MFEFITFNKLGRFIEFVNTKLYSKYKEKDEVKFSFLNSEFQATKILEKQSLKQEIENKLHQALKYNSYPP